MFYCQLPCYHLANANPNCLPLPELDAVRLVKRTRNLFSSFCFKKGRSSFFLKFWEMMNSSIKKLELMANGAMVHIVYIDTMWESYAVQGVLFSKL